MRIFWFILHDYITMHGAKCIKSHNMCPSIRKYLTMLPKAPIISSSSVLSTYFLSPRYNLHTIWFSSALNKNLPFTSSTNI